MIFKTFKKVNIELFRKVRHNLQERFHKPEIICYCGETFFKSTYFLILDNKGGGIFNPYLMSAIYGTLYIYGIRIIQASNLDANEAQFIVIGRENEYRQVHRRTRKKQRVKRVRRKNKNSKRKPTRNKTRRP